MDTQAQKIYESYFKIAQAQPRRVVAQLSSIVVQIENACLKQEQQPGSREPRTILQNALDKLINCTLVDLVKRS